MSPFVAEILGTMTLILLGDGVVANVVLKGTKGNNSGWIVITMGWGLAVFTGVVVASAGSGAHLNPAVTVGLAMAGNVAWSAAPGYIAAQMIGAAIGAFLVWLHYKDHFAVTDDPGTKLAVFATGPEIRSTTNNLISEIIGTFVLVFAVLLIVAPSVGLGSLDALPVALVVLVIGPRPGRDHRIRHQSGSRPGPADHACNPPDPRKGRLGLGLQLDSRGRSDCGRGLGGGRLRTGDGVTRAGGMSRDQLNARPGARRPVGWLIIAGMVCSLSTYGVARWGETSTGLHNHYEGLAYMMVSGYGYNRTTWDTWRESISSMRARSRDLAVQGERLGPDNTIEIPPARLLPDLFRMPGYPLFLRGVYATLGEPLGENAKRVQALLVFLLPFLVYRLALLFVSSQTALIASVVSALYPPIWASFGVELPAGLGLLGVLGTVVLIGFALERRTLWLFRSSWTRIGSGYLSASQRAFASVAAGPCDSDSGQEPLGRERIHDPRVVDAHLPPPLGDQELSDNGILGLGIYRNGQHLIQGDWGIPQPMEDRAK